MAQDTKVPQDGAGDVPEGFTLSLALVDAIPVILFCLSAITLGLRLSSPLFVAGAVVTFAAGACKVCWKLVIALARRNVRILNRQMRYVMPLGFFLMLIGALMRLETLAGVLFGLLGLPNVVFLAGWIVCMGAMGHFACSRQQDDVRSNWMEQGVNAVGQACLLLALVL